ncbi:MAG: phosphoribosyltransferase family protein [Flavobacteriales bacterium]
MKQIILHNKVFVPFIDREKIEQTVQKMALEIYEKYKHTTPVFVGVLNGVILFFSDFLKNYPGRCEIAFIQLSSYRCMSSSGEVKVILDWPIDIYGRDVVIFEDIIDTGNTLEKLYEMVCTQVVKSVKIATLFLKPEVFKSDLNIDFIGMRIPNKFFIGYGLDLDGIGRNYPDIYQLKDEA